jgi:hypothetical protein
VPAEDLGNDGTAPDLRHVTTLRVKAPFTRPNGPQSPLKGTHRYARQLFDKNGPLQSLPTKLFSHPDPSQLRQTLYKRARNPKPCQNLNRRKPLSYRQLVLNVWFTSQLAPIQVF